MKSKSKEFMDVARSIAKMSKDPKTKVGCVIVDNQNHILSTGYNGFPPGVEEPYPVWHSKTKYDYVIHAEANALIHGNNIRDKAYKMYCTMFPCAECAKLICSTNIKYLYYADEKYKNDLSVLLFKLKGIQCLQLD